MKFFKKALIAIAILFLVGTTLTCSWASRLTDAEVKEYVMWINLFKNGYAPPMKMDNEPSPWWKFWEAK